MKQGIARKLAATYLTIIIATIISGAFCLYVLNKNQRASSEMRYVTLPSLEYLKEMKVLHQEVKKLANTWVFITNVRDQERLLTIVNNEYPQLLEKLSTSAGKWTDDDEKFLFGSITTTCNRIIDSVHKITVLLNSPETYTNDQLVDQAASINSQAGKLIGINDKLFDQLIDTKEQNLESQQNSIGKLMNLLYLIIALTIVIVGSVSFFSMRFSKKNIVSPLLELNHVIMSMAVGKVVAIEEIDRDDEIGQMHNAITKMISGIIQKVNFSEQIGKGNYDVDFKLLSANDKLGTALLTMRDDLRRSTESLIEQDRRLIEAQKIARVGNFYSVLAERVFQSSPTFDEILGIDDTFEKTNENWVSLITPEFKSVVKEKGEEAFKSKSRFLASYIINRYKTQEERWVSVIGEFTYDAGGNIVTMFGTLQDITESKALEIELNKSYNVATEQNRRLLNFSYIVSHNLRMHAVNIESLLSLLDESESEEESKEVLELLHKASRHLDETLHNLNEVVAMQNALNLEIGPQVLKDHIDHAIGIMQSQIEHKHALVVNNVKEKVIVNYNPAYLDSIILNFISNAIKYSHPDRQPMVTIDCFREHQNMTKSKWILQISDNGLGIDMKRHGHKLFGMYKTFHGNKDAKGMGLFMTKYQIEAMGGDVEVESESGKGTTFRIYIK